MVEVHILIYKYNQPGLPLQVVKSPIDSNCPSLALCGATVFHLHQSFYTLPSWRLASFGATPDLFLSLFRAGVANVAHDRRC